MSLKKEKINLLVMPTDVCNMNCIYCFHSEHHEKKGKMSYDTLRKLYNIAFLEYREVSIIWHGGEPLVMGLDFYKMAIEMQKEYNCNITNRMQSNLTLLTDEFAKFLCENNVGIGTSFDGCQNDITRGFTQKILDGRTKILHNHKRCGFIMVVSKVNIDTLINSYEYFKSINANFTLNTYVPCGNEKDEFLKLDIRQTIDKIKELFDYWLKDINCQIHIDYFERIIRFLITGEKNICKYNSCLGKWVGIRYNGDIVPCNRYFPNDYCYGNVQNYDKLSDAFESEGFRKILSASISRREKCKLCIAFPLCSGGCNNVALNENGINDNNGDSCKIFREVYQYIVETTIELIRNGDFSIYNPIFASIVKVKKIRGFTDFHYDVYHNR